MRRTGEAARTRGKRRRRVDGNDALGASRVAIRARVASRRRRRRAVDANRAAAASKTRRGRVARRAASSTSPRSDADVIFSFIFPRRARESGLVRTARRRRARLCASAARLPRRTRAALWRWSGYAERCTWCLTCACGLRDVRCDVCSGNAPEVNNCRFLGQPGRSSDAETRLRRRTEE